MTGKPTHTASEMGAAHPSYINYRLKSEVSIMLRCQLCSTRYTAIRIKNFSRRTSTIYAYQKKWCGTPILLIIVSIHYASLSAMFNPLHSNTNQELLEKRLCNQNSHYEKYRQFPCRREAIMCSSQIDTFPCQQR